MKHINGYICVANIDMPCEKFPNKTQRIMFGQPPEEDLLEYYPKEYSCLELGGIKLFNNLEHALIGKYALDKRTTFSEVKVAGLELEIGETFEEIIENFSDRMPLIIIADRSRENNLTDIDFYGAHTECSSVYPLYGGSLRFNNFKTIDKLNWAIFIAKEINRQGQMATKIATFKLDYIF
jgi:hypothetical protein